MSKSKGRTRGGGGGKKRDSDEKRGKLGPKYKLGEKPTPSTQKSNQEGKGHRGG